MRMSTVYLSGAHAPNRRSRGAFRPGAAAPLCVAGLCVAALALTWVVAALVPPTHVKDAVALYDFTLLGGPRLDEVANALLQLLDPVLYTLWGLMLVAVALRRRRPRLALAVALVLGLAPLTAEMLKPLLAHPRLRPTVATLGAMFVAGVGFSLLILAWHLPSDVLGGYLVGTLWVALAVACLRAADARLESRRLRGRVRAVGTGVP